MIAVEPRQPQTSQTRDATQTGESSQQQHAPASIAAASEVSATNPISENHTQVTILSSAKNPAARLQAAQKQSARGSREEDALVEYCSGCFVDLYGSRNYPEYYEQYIENRSLLRKFLHKLPLENREGITTDFVMASKKQKGKVAPTVLFTCRNEGQKLQIELGLKELSGQSVIP
jgi:hypothetical protein